MAQYLEKALAAYAPHLIPSLLKALHTGAIDGDRTLIKMGLEMYGALGKGSGIVINNINQNSATAAASASSYDKSFDSVIRRASEKKRALLESQGNAEVIDVEAVSAG